MERMKKRGLSLLLALALCISLLSGITINASAAEFPGYTYDGEYIYNWGERETVATFLSPNAEAFYTGSYTYDALSAKSGDTLYNILQDLMEGKHSHKTSYNETKDLYQYTDCQNGGGKISSFYSGKAIGPSWDGSWNREHTWPNSKGLGGQDENDIMMLRPTSTSENSSRGNTAYGESSGYYDPNSESGGRHDLHGDVARLMLYTYVRWGNKTRMWGSNGVMESTQVLLKWIEEDPVDTWELGRNDAVEAITGTRNVFVDYPELAFLMLNEDIPADMTTPSGMAAAGTGYTVTVTVNNAAYGSASVSGSTITAVPADGYYAEDYIVTSGNATVTQDGNTFRVKATSDCTVQIVFKEKTAAKITFQQDGSAVSKDVYLGDSITLPEHSGAVPTGYSFVGWTSGPVSETATKPAFYAAGKSYTVTENTTLHALYCIVKGGSSGNTYTLHSGELVEGNYIIVHEDMALAAADANGDQRIDVLPITASGNSLENPDSSIVWRLSRSGDGWVIYNESTGLYAAGIGTKNRAGLITEITNYAKWTYANGDFENIGNRANSINATLRYNSAVTGFGCYSTSTGATPTLYVNAGTAYYTTAVNSTIPTLPTLKFSGATLELENGISINFKAKSALFTEGNHTNPYAVFELNGMKYTVNTYKEVGDSYVFQLYNIRPDYMNDKVTATLYSDQAVSESVQYSIADYCYKTLGKYTDAQYAELQTLIVDLLNYGAASQVYTGHNPDALVTAALTEAQNAYGTPDSKELDLQSHQNNQQLEGAAANWKGAALALQEVPRIQMKLETAVTEGLVVRISTGSSQWTVSQSDFTVDEKGRLVVTFDKLSAVNMRTPVTFTVYQGDTAVSGTATYSIESYAASKIGNSATDAKLVGILKAMMRYGDSAYNYVY